MRIRINVVLILLLFTVFSCKQDKKLDAYKTEEFVFRGRSAKVVFPDVLDSKKPWIWRARFWGTQPQTEEALLNKGFHVVYIDVADFYGNMEAVSIWNDFYEYVVEKYNLNKKVVLQGFSRGGLVVYNWAAQNTDKVFCIYADAPVCDIKSWPGGFFEGKGSKADWEKCLATYYLDEDSVLTFEGMPIYNAVMVAKAKIPVLHVCGDLDKIVPYEENTAILEKKFKEAGGDIQVILKKGVGHHPHSLKDATSIVNFILKNSIGNVD